MDNINTLLGQHAGVLDLRMRPFWDLKKVSLVCQLRREARGFLLLARGVLRVTGENMTAVVKGLDDS